MENKVFDVFEGIDLTSEEIQFYDFKKEVSNYIIELIKRRIELKMSQRDLAEKTGIKQPMIARIESFDTVPRLDTLLKITKALDLKLSFEKEVVIDLNINITVDYKIVNYNSYNFVTKDFDINSNGNSVTC